ncbi:MAG: 4-hydroxy-tetrahydrodipicolinate synthase [Gammaproteobacteria bacterium]|nr:4-hydroxy-tetrahydrodipicolinate synthase [Gammaproteobacteria bacterium]|tara:strand:- start:482 stop:1381 length:900 start_codon:yes stop_codon:yes gene_type:complete
MNSSLKSEIIKGSIPPVVTPFKNGKVDLDTYSKLIEFHIIEGSHGVLVNGTSAEPSTLAVTERNQLVDVAIATTNNSIPIVAATGSQSLEETRVLTKYAAKAGVDALLIVTPYYIRPPQRGIIEYYLEATQDIDIPWMIYHIPGRAAVTITIDTIRELKETSPTFVGMKHAVNDLGFVSECLAEFHDFKVFVGLEELSFPELAIGAVGLMNAVGNLRPSILAEMCQAVWDNDLQKGKKLHHELFELNQSVFYDTNPIPIKYMMKRMGILPNNEHRLPMSPATPELEKRLEEVLIRANLI